MVISDRNYIQKSKLFLRPLIDIRRDKFIKPVGTFIRNDKFSEFDLKLILPFEKDDSSEFHYYEKELIDSPFFQTDEYYETKKYLVYVYDLSKFKSDYDKFLEGKYSEFSNKSKMLINIHWGTIIAGQFKPHPKIESYLNPNLLIYEKLSEELEIPVKDLIKVREILDPPDIEKETFVSDDRISKVKREGGDTVESPSD